MIKEKIEYDSQRAIKRFMRFSEPQRLIIMEFVLVAVTSTIRDRLLEHIKKSKEAKQ